MNLTHRAHILALLNAMMNEVQMAEHDPDEALLADFPEVIEAIEQTIPVLERMFPALQAIDEVLNGDISPTLFIHKWENVIEHFQFPNQEEEEIGQDVLDLLARAAKGDPEGEST